MIKEKNGTQSKSIYFDSRVDFYNADLKSENFDLKMYELSTSY